ncbi:hypothetical protein BHM03_00003987 [Ensete ventricosum]|nr:hypothetical protein BHM03_00003987 [Ensete ventricosum]
MTHCGRHCLVRAAHESLAQIILYILRISFVNSRFTPLHPPPQTPPSRRRQPAVASVPQLDHAAVERRHVLVPVPPQVPPPLDDSPLQAAATAAPKRRHSPVDVADAVNVLLLSLPQAVAMGAVLVQTVGRGGVVRHEPRLRTARLLHVTARRPGRGSDLSPHRRLRLGRADGQAWHRRGRRRGGGRRVGFGADNPDAPQAEGRGGARRTRQAQSDLAAAAAAGREYRRKARASSGTSRRSITERRLSDCGGLGGVYVYREGSGDEFWAVGWERDRGGRCRKNRRRCRGRYSHDGFILYTWTATIVRCHVRLRSLFGVQISSPRFEDQMGEEVKNYDALTGMEDERAAEVKAEGTAPSIPSSSMRIDISLPLDQMKPRIVSALLPSS